MSVPHRLLPGWSERVERASSIPRLVPIVPRKPAFFAERISVITTAAGAGEFAELAASRTVSHVGFDTEYTYQRPRFTNAKGKEASDPQGQVPLLVSLAVVESGADPGAIYPAVFDVRQPGVLPGLQAVLDLAVPVVGHFLKVDVFSLWQLGLRIPAQLWDTWVVEKALSLGIFHKNYHLHPAADEAEQALAAEEQEAAVERHCSLIATCERYGVQHRFSADKDRLQQSFLAYAPGARFTQEQFAYAAEDAVAAAQLYPLQVQAVGSRGMLAHLVRIEQPWVEVNARIEWHGVLVDQVLASRVRKHCDHHLAHVDAEILGLLREHRDAMARTSSRPPLVIPAAVERGDKPAFRSRSAHLAYLASKPKLLELFREGDATTIDRDHLKEAIGRDPLLDLLYIAKRLDALTRDCVLEPAVAGCDGRVHPQQRQLGADTGRQTTTLPNILGLPGVLRPLVIASPGMGIGEVDLSQIEVGVAGAVYRNAALVEMYNAGDVYIGMARTFARDEMTPEMLTLPDQKALKHPQLAALRATMKPLTLGIIYRRTAHGIARQLGLSTDAAQALLDRFLAMFPGLVETQAAHIRQSGLRGFAATVTGLRRYRAGPGRPTNWEKNWINNLPVQGSAAAAFKLAGIRLHRLYPAFDARMIAVVHDAVVFEAPQKHLAAVAELTRQALCEAVQELFPVLRPRATVNIEHPHCWNKDGDVSSLERWLDDPAVLLKGKGFKRAS